VILNLTREEAIVLREIAVQQRGRYVYLAKHTALRRLLKKLERLLQ